jgi:ComF family protein
MMLSWISTGLQAVQEVLFPSCCSACGKKLMQEEQVICSSCLSSIARTEHHVLQDNGIDMLFAERIKKGNKHIRYQSGAAFAFYNRERGQILRQLIEGGKYGDRPYPEIFFHLGKLAAQEYVDADLFDGVDLLVPIPLHPRRLRERGFNQAEWICRGLNEVLNIPIDTEHLVRTRNNAHQSQSQFDARGKNVENIFAIRYPEEWKNKHILLVDDVITSGSTLYSCMQNTTSIRGCRVSVFTLGWAHN